MTARAEGHIFTPPGVDVSSRLQRVTGENQILDPKQVTSEYLQLFNSVQSENEDWIEARFHVLRQGMHSWSLDGILVDEEGRIVDGPWSTY